MAAAAEKEVGVPLLDERQIELAVYGLRRSEDRVIFEVDPGPGWLLGELSEWLEEDRQWLSPHTRQWTLLLDDLQRARVAAGPRLRAHLEQLGDDWREVSECRIAIAKTKRSEVLAPSLRLRLKGASSRLRDRLLVPETLGAAFDDLLGATDHLGARRAAGRLRDLIDLQGLDSAGLSKALAAILEDELLAVKEARGERVSSADLRADAGLTPTERVQLCKMRLAKVPRRAEAVVWLEYVLAPVGAGRLEVGEAVKIYSSGWLRDAIEEGRTEELPPELATAPGETNVARLADVGTDENDRREDLVTALVRVYLGEVQTESALQLARESAELVISLAVLLGGDPTIWLPSGSWARFYDGRPAGASFHAPPVNAVSLDHRQAMRSDAMPDFVEEWGEKLPGHLPPRGQELRSVGRLALWLRRSRETWGPGRLVLCGRILEQIAGWAGVGGRYRFAEEFLRLSWALRRVGLEVGNSWRAVVAAHWDGDPTLLPGAWEEIVAERAFGYAELADGRYVFNQAGVIEKVDFLRERLDPDSAPHERLTALRANTADGPATARWIGSLEKEFDVFAERERRLRNALVHGGAVGEEVPESTTLFVDWLAAEALHAAIEGTLAGTDLVAHFLEFRSLRETRRRKLEEGVRPSEALFWRPG
jgi:hypothetical protein